ncbi:hypothetical protein [Candidatus Hodarchaeum mangrovi]
MEIEYQDKESITWCLDREGPRICLLAIRKAQKIEKIKIESESFALELDGEEVGVFLDILRKVTGIKELPLIKTEKLRKEKEDLIIDHSILSQIESHEEIQETPDDYSDQVIIPPLIDQTDKITIQDADDSTHFEEGYKVETTLEDDVEATVDDISQKYFAEVLEPRPPEIPATSEILEILKKTESAVDKILMAEDVKEEIIDPTEDVASFFRESRQKSPLEELLDKDGNIREDLGDPIKVPDYTKKIEAFKDLDETEKSLDHQTESFIKKFDTKDALNILDSSQKEKVESKDSIEEEFQPSSQISIQKDSTPRVEYQTEAERRAAIEKERAERRRRLWELTRGF